MLGPQSVMCSSFVFVNLVFFCSAKCFAIEVAIEAWLAPFLARLYQRSSSI